MIVNYDYKIALGPFSMQFDLGSVIMYDRGAFTRLASGHTCSTVVTSY